MYVFLKILKTKGKLRESTGCQYESMKIECPVNQNIKIKYAMYGRISQFKCLNNNMEGSKCASDIEKTIQIVGNQCNLKNSCIIDVNSTNFDDSCKDIQKYLDVKYECK